MVNRDVSGLGVDHLNDVDLNDLTQVEIIKVLRPCSTQMEQLEE